MSFESNSNFGGVGALLTVLTSVFSFFSLIGTLVTRDDHQRTKKFLYFPNNGFLVIMCGVSENIKRKFIFHRANTEYGLIMASNVSSESQKAVAYGAGIGIAMGSGLGLIFGLLTDNVGLSVGIGAALGIVFGSAFTSMAINKKRKQSK
jgi:hypothetical protein